MPWTSVQFSSSRCTHCKTWFPEFTSSTSCERCNHRIVQCLVFFVELAERLSVGSFDPQEWPTVDATSRALIGQFASLKVPPDCLRIAQTWFRASRMALSVRDEQSRPWERRVHPSCRPQRRSTVVLTAGEEDRVGGHIRSDSMLVAISPAKSNGPVEESQVSACPLIAGPFCDLSQRSPACPGKLCLRQSSR